MWIAVLVEAHRRGHVDNSFDELGLLQARHRIVATLELVAGQAIAVDQRRNHVAGRSRLHESIDGG